jgi:hypothetical protein
MNSVMKPALIKLTRRVLLDPQTDDSTLGSIYSSAREMLNDIFSGNGFSDWDSYKRDPLMVKNTHRILNTENRQLKTFAANYSEVFPGIPPAQVKVISATLEVVDGERDNLDSYQFALHLVLEPMTLLDTMGNSLLLALGDKSKEYNDGHELEALLLPMGEEYRIKYYKRI